MQALRVPRSIGLALRFAGAVCRSPRRGFPNSRSRTLPRQGSVGQSRVDLTRIGMLSDHQRQLHEELGIPIDYGSSGRPPYFADATELVDVGPNLVGRMQQLTPEAARRWQEMVAAAAANGIPLLIVSGFRSFDYQTTLIRNKLTAGQDIAEILRVNAAPGFSQHHSGRAVDIATPGSRPLTEAFEETQAFVWLTKNASKFGFSMSYPRDNPYGFIYEPWHWSM